MLQLLSIWCISYAFPLKCLNWTIFLLTQKFRLRKLDCSSQKPHCLNAVLETSENKASLALIDKTTVRSSSRGCKWNTSPLRHFHAVQCHQLLSPRIYLPDILELSLPSTKNLNVCLWFHYLLYCTPPHLNPRSSLTPILVVESGLFGLTGTTTVGAVADSAMVRQPPVGQGEDRKAPAQGAAHYLPWFTTNT